MKRYIYIGVFSLMVLMSTAQESSDVWTMDRCMQYAVEHSTGVMKKQYEAASSRSDYHSAVASFFPTLDAQTGGQYNWGRGINPETNTYSNVTTFNNYYELYTSLSVFDAGRTFNQWRQAKVGRQLGYNNVQKAKDDKAIEVMQAFVDVVYTQGCVKLAEDKLKESRMALHKVERQEELGLKGKPDVAQIKAQEAEDDYNLTHQQNLYDAALLKLKTAMNFPTKDLLPVDTTMQHFSPLMRVENSDDLFQYASNNNPDAMAASLNVKKSRLQYSIDKSKLMPSLTFSAGINTNYYENLSNNSTVQSFHSQMKNNRGEFLYATLRIPIVDFVTRSTVKRSRNNMLISQLEKDETMRKLQSDIEQAVMDCNGYAKEITQMENKVDADSLAFHATSRKFEEGMQSAIDLYTSANTLLLSRVTLLQKRMLYVLKDRLVDYYKGESLIKQ